MSARWSTTSAAACSGAMYCGVPIEVPTRVSVSFLDWLCSATDSALATPKSATHADPPESSTLSGLMSRCTTPRACAKASARATSLRMLTVCAIDSGPRASRVRSDSPSTNGIVKYGSPPVSPALSTPTMCGCWSAAESMISRRNLSADSSEAISGDRTFTTIWRWSFLSRATYTRLMPPPPSSDSMSKSAPRACWTWSRRSVIEGPRHGTRGESHAGWTTSPPLELAHFTKA